MIFQVWGPKDPIIRYLGLGYVGSYVVRSICGRVTWFLRARTLRGFRDPCDEHPFCVVSVLGPKP